MTSWQNEEHVDEPEQPELQDPDATEDHDPATPEDDEKRSA